MIRLFFYLLLVGAIIFAILWLKARFDRLDTRQKKQLTSLGLHKAVQLLRVKWYAIAMIVWRILKGVMKK